MSLGLFLVTLGCTLRVSCEVLAYQGSAAWAWNVLPASALIELKAPSVFTVNMLCTFVLQKSHAVNKPMMGGRPQLVAAPNSRYGGKLQNREYRRGLARVGRSTLSFGGDGAAMYAETPLGHSRFFAKFFFLQEGDTHHAHG